MPSKIHTSYKSKCSSPQSHKDGSVRPNNHARNSGCWFKGTGTAVWRFSSTIRAQQVCSFIRIIDFLVFLCLDTHHYESEQRKELSDKLRYKRRKWKCSPGLPKKKKGETVKSKHRCPIISEDGGVFAPQARRAERLLTDAGADWQSTAWWLHSVFFRKPNTCQKLLNIFF